MQIKTSCRQSTALIYNQSSAPPWNPIQSGVQWKMSTLWRAPWWQSMSRFVSSLCIWSHLLLSHSINTHLKRDCIAFEGCLLSCVDSKLANAFVLHARFLWWLKFEIFLNVFDQSDLKAVHCKFLACLPQALCQLHYDGFIWLRMSMVVSCQDKNRTALKLSTRLFIVHPYQTWQYMNSYCVHKKVIW